MAWLDTRVVIRTTPEILVKWNELKAELDLKTSNNLILFLIEFYKKNSEAK